MDIQRMKLFNKNIYSTTIDKIEVLNDFLYCCGYHGQVLKGGMALEILFGDTTPSPRSTIDIDYHLENEKNWNEFKNNAFEVATENSKLGIKYTLKSNKITKSGETLVVQYDTEDLSNTFQIDMNFGTYCSTQCKQGIVIYSLEMILADKITVVCNEKILRRAKDLYDIYLIVCKQDFDLVNLCEEIKLKLDSRNWKLNSLNLLNPKVLKDLDHAYYMLKGINFPKLETVVEKCVEFILPILDYFKYNLKKDRKWYHERGVWTGPQHSPSVGYNIKGVICRETASGMLGMSTFPQYPMLVYNDYINMKLSRFNFIKEDISIYHTGELIEGLLITDETDTLIDLCENGEYRILVESFTWYLKKNNDLKELKERARVLGKLDAVERVMKELKDGGVI